MAAPKQSLEQAFRLRKFQGTNTDIDATFLGPTLVGWSENWIPAQSYRLGKRPGTLLFQRLANGVTSVTDLIAAPAATGNHVLYAYGRRAGGAIVLQIVDESALTAVATFPNATAVGRFVRFRDRVYAGNGVDPLKSWKVGTAATDIQNYLAIASLGAPPVATPASISPNVAPLPDGTYAYTWAVYNTTTGFYTGRYSAGSVVVPAQSNVTFPRPAVPAAPEVLRLFVAYRGFPIEYATMQADNPPADVVVEAVDVTPVRCPTVGITRTGNMLLVWRNRVVFAGSQADPCAVCATDVILPGLEQATFNQGTFFPVGARVLLPANVTGIGIAGVTSDQDAKSPLLFFTETRTFLCMGDPFSTVDAAELTEISSRIGCVGHDSIVNTPIGTIFVGLDSVYMIPPGGGYPEDIGWPIADQIRNIPAGQRATIVGQFHKQFYKLALPSKGGAGNMTQWWLDLRQGVGSPPSWWGPHSGTTVTAVAADLSTLQEVDRGYAAHSGDVLVLTHQTSRFADYVPASDMLQGIKSVLRSGRLDGDAPFIAKVFTRLRLIAQTNAHSFINVNIRTDGGTFWTIDDIELGANMLSPGRFVHLDALPPPIPSYHAFNHGKLNAAGMTRGLAQFGSVAPVEVQTITPAIRPRGLSAVVTLIHQPELDNLDFAAKVELRDFELLFIPSERKVRYLGESTGK